MELVLNQKIMDLLNTQHGPQNGPFSGECHLKQWATGRATKLVSVINHLLIAKYGSCPHHRNGGLIRVCSVSTEINAVQFSTDCTIKLW